ncbi:MAG: VOC family protein [Burkholderiales bacterium]|jgi:hypothetical protein
MNVVTWFQLPAADLERAMRFYSRVLGARFHRKEAADGVHAFFDRGESGVGGELVSGPGWSPSQSGALVFLYAPAGVDAAVAEVANAGGTVVVPNTSIDPFGHIAIVMDTEGNRVGLHGK